VYVHSHAEIDIEIQDLFPHDGVCCGMACARGGRVRVLVQYSIEMKSCQVHYFLITRSSHSAHLWSGGAYYNLAGKAFTLAYGVFFGASP
jgi:hypothetical protein